MAAKKTANKRVIRAKPEDDIRNGLLKKRGRPVGSKNKPKVEAKKPQIRRGRAKKSWHIEIFLDGKRKGAYNGETLVEALIVAEEKLIYDVEHKEDKFYGHGN